MRFFPNPSGHFPYPYRVGLVIVGLSGRGGLTIVGLGGRVVVVPITVVLVVLTTEFTVMEVFPTTLSEVAKIVAVPGVTPVATPAASIVATNSSLLLH